MRRQQPTAGTLDSSGPREAYGPLHPDHQSSIASPRFRRAELGRLLRIGRYFTTPYHHEGNGLCERVFSTFQEMLRTYIRPDQGDWDLFLPACAFAYNTFCLSALFVCLLMDSSALLPSSPTLPVSEFDVPKPEPADTATPTPATTDDPDSIAADVLADLLVNVTNPPFDDADSLFSPKVGEVSPIHETEADREGTLFLLSRIPLFCIVLLQPLKEWLTRQMLRLRLLFQAGLMPNQ
ncbi:unnamed protein product [Heligmosomoides polygyrus]|uniref:Integrase catalytic domain-containing protein n=1 Tax=Heligmosomoides polygyrus TaxID=6339 RepID=A0A183G947_HELPZ|nr:unnamed protein product [Heligmosomoides polygyrus]